MYAAHLRHDVASNLVRLFRATQLFLAICTVLYCTSLYQLTSCAQDVLIPWHRPAPASSAGESEGGAGAGGRDTTTTCTSEEDVTHYHAYTQVDIVDICRYL